MDWLTGDIVTLTATAATIGVVHTLLGPDHYLPFIALARARGWRTARTLTITALCGLGHAAGSVLLGGIGIAMGLSLTSLTGIESQRLNLAAWAMIAFGLAWAAWGARSAWRRHHRHSHAHVHADGTVHRHPHDHTGGHGHVHDAPGGRAAARLAGWSLFIIFVLGPCEALIPLLMYPAAQHNMPGLVLVTLTFVIATVTTMVAAVALARHALPGTAWLRHCADALAGLAIALCGAAVLGGW